MPFKLQNTTVVITGLVPVIPKQMAWMGHAVTFFYLFKIGQRLVLKTKIAKKSKKVKTATRQTN